MGELGETVSPSTLIRLVSHLNLDLAQTSLSWLKSSGVRVHIELVGREHSDVSKVA